MTLSSIFPVRNLYNAYNRSSHVIHVEIISEPDQEDPQGLIDNGLAQTAAIGTAVLQTTDRNCVDIESLKREVSIWPKLANQLESLEQKVESLEQRVGSLEQKVGSLEQKTQSRFDKLEQRVDKLELELHHIRGMLENEQSVRRNGKRFKLYHRIEPVKASKFSVEKGAVEWILPKSFPKHLKAFRDIGNHAKGLFAASEILEKPQHLSTIQASSIQKILELVNFYGISLFNDDKSESDATEIDLTNVKDHIDEFMEALGDEWGLNWFDVRRIPDEEPNILAAKKRGLYEREGLSKEERNVRVRE